MLHCLIGYSAFSISECSEGDMSTICNHNVGMCVITTVCVHNCVRLCVCLFVSVCMYVCMCMCVCMLEVYRYRNFGFYRYRLYCCQDLPITNH